MSTDYIRFNMPPLSILNFLSVIVEGEGVACTHVTSLIVALLLKIHCTNISYDRSNMFCILSEGLLCHSTAGEVCLCLYEI